MDEEIKNESEEIIENSEDSVKSEKKKQKKQDGEIKELKKVLEEKQAELEALNDKYLRLMAEYDNFRKRTQKEREGIYTDACTDVISSILPVIDNVERAVTFNDAQSVSKGVEMILRSFIEILEKLGVHEIESLGKTFDPNLHNAVMHIEDEQYGENEIIEVLQKGYIKGDKVIRFSVVKVAN